MTHAKRRVWDRLTRGVRVWGDLAGAALALVLAGIPLLGAPEALPGPVRVGLTLLVTVLLPGYAVGLALLPGLRAGADRITVSLGLGLVVPSIAGLALHVFEIGIRSGTWIIPLVSVTLLSLITAALRRPARAARGGAKPTAGERRWAASAFGAALLIGVLALLLRTTGSAETNAPFTQLWVTPDVASPSGVHIGVANHEAVDRAYELIVSLDGVPVDELRFTLGDRETWRHSVAIDATASRVEARLYRLPDTSTPYRRVSISVPAS